MNWLKKTLRFGEKIKQLLKKRPSKSDIENSDWTSCCKGPVLKKDLEENLWVCNACGKHHRINCIQRFDIIFGKNNYEVLKTPIPADDPLEFEDSSPYIKKLNSARKKTNQDCAVMIAKGKIGNIDAIVGAINFAFMGGSIATSEGEAIIFGIAGVQGYLTGDSSVEDKGLQTIEAETQNLQSAVDQTVAGLSALNNNLSSAAKATSGIVVPKDISDNISAYNSNLATAAGKVKSANELYESLNTNLKEINSSTESMNMPEGIGEELTKMKQTINELNAKYASMLEGMKK